MIDTCEHVEQQPEVNFFNLYEEQFNEGFIKDLFKLITKESELLRDLDYVYDKKLPVKTRSCINSIEVDKEYKESKIGKTYGEPTYETMKKIWNSMKGCYFNENCSFLDIGSGFGKMVFLVAAMSNIVSCGQEFVPVRAQYTIDLKNDMLEKYKTNDEIIKTLSKVNFFRNDASK